MGVFREAMLGEMRLRGFAARTQRTYASWMSEASGARSLGRRNAGHSPEVVASSHPTPKLTTMQARSRIGRWASLTWGWYAVFARACRQNTRPQSKRMQLTKLRAAPVRQAEVPPCAPAG